MLDYDKFLELAATIVLSRYNAGRIAWRDAIGDIVLAAAIIYNRLPYDINQDIWNQIESTGGY